MSAPRFDEIDGEEVTAPSFDAIEDDATDPDASRAPAPFGPDPAGSFEGAEVQAAGALTPGRKPPRNPGVMRSIGSEALQGFYKGGSDEAAGLITQAAVPTGTGAAWRQPDGSTRMLNTGGDAYRAGRDSEREVLRGAEEHYPKISFAARTFGDVASDAVAAVLGVPAGKLYNTATGALSGGLSSEADLTQGDPEAYAWTAGNAILGGLLGRYVPEAVKGVVKFTPAALRAARTFTENLAANTGRRVLLNGADSMSNRKPVPPEAVWEAIRSGGILPFGTTQGAFKRLEGLADERGSVYGNILEQLEAAGVKGPDAEELAAQLAAEAEKRLAVSGSNTAIPDLFTREAEAVLERPVGRSVGVTDLGLNQAEGIKRTLQKEAQYGRVEETPINEARRDVASMYRSGIEDSVREAGEAAPQGSQLRELAESFEPIKRRLANTIEARNAAERGAQRVAARRGMSLSDYVAAGMGSGITEKLSLGTLNNLARNRGTSAVASTAYGLSRIAAAGAEGVAANPAAVANAAGKVGVSAARVGMEGQGGVDTERGAANLSDSELLTTLSRENPEALGPYANTLQKASAEGNLAVVHYVLQQRDPEYRQMLEANRAERR